ncbi:LysM peptidoglycan-binding domain-containing protein [Enterococcus faecium]|uniref:LysM peptidoglycan-binding domain-containing protein n=1 Tax=Enterococcus faecium TaxID=1352 RepID=UPI001911BC6B|nr:LysM peptidoglycan-binding domain-containing protein [Enterococcus faecium]MBK5028813.1 LysM peptidoglycan-binding domain-containing protein [Enterococcus faecium]MBK5039474.1 LysM peptidoglycan-binding domain-containing protein [Enterococcus faecium]MBK5044394.1 LysM peptidoglycan-binding domain-containing protein [Enterococcus faecium]MBK5069396.1 LysM peptidoglycan-binding domain-containing protein [Enterococcus faecium]MBK5132567.1 LysM peptidoglycan-binding domain-containing protein [E
MKLLKVFAIGATIGGVALATAHEKVDAAEWTPRTVEQIKADMKGNEYTIVWGDTLSGISQATNISVQKLADMNKIANVDLIYAGNKLVFDGNVATVQNNKGETVAQSVIQPQDKVDSTKPVGQPVQGTTNSATQNTTTPLIDNTVTDNTQTGDQTTGNTGTTTPSTPENNGGTTQTPTQPDNNQNGSTGGNTGGGQTTPSNPGNNDGNQGGSTGGNNGGSTTNPSQPTTPEKPVQYKYTVWGNFDDPKYNIVEGQHIFDTQEEARAWIDNYADNLLMQGIGSSSYGTTSWEVQ